MIPRLPTWLSARVAATLLVFGLAPGVRAQTLSGRPLRTESVDTLAFGEHVLELGAEAYADATPTPLLDPTARGRLIRGPIVRYRAGLGRAEIQVAGPIHQSFSPDDGSLRDADEVGDFATWLKVQAVRPRGRRPGLGVLLGTKLPNASDESGLGTDETDAFLGVVLSRAMAGHEMRLNFGLAILGDPLEERAQQDVLTFGVGGRHGERHAAIWEVWGRAFGDGDRGLDEAHVRVGYVRTSGSFTFDVSAILGLADSSDEWGLSVGTAWKLGRPRGS